MIHIRLIAYCLECMKSFETHRAVQVEGLIDHPHMVVSQASAQMTPPLIKAVKECDHTTADDEG